MSEWVLEAQELRKSFGALHAVDGISLAVAPGQAYGLVGPDGAGKTTTMRLLVGALHSDGGQVWILGQELHQAGPRVLDHVGYLPQRFSLYGDLTVHENLNFFGTVRGVRGQELRDRSAELLHFVGLSGFEGRLADALSGGMKQKLSLACALIHRPRLLLLDEPTGGVDPVTRQDFWQLIIRLLTGGVAVVVSTPYMDEAARCSRLGFMHKGRLLIQGAPRELTRLLAGRVYLLAAQPKALAREVCLADPDVEDVAAFGDRLHLRTRAGAAETGPASLISRLAPALATAGAVVGDFRPVPPSLEDIFIALQENALGPLLPVVGPTRDDAQQGEASG